MKNFYAKCFPKINIFLKIIGKNNIGYHLLNSRFALVKGKLFDELEISQNSAFELVGDFGCELENNTIFKAKIALENVLQKRPNFENLNLKLLNSVKVSVKKNIPKGAGLGGGSSNAGAFVNAFCQMAHLSLSDSEILEIANFCGADTMFFLKNFDSANVSGIGEIVREFDENLPEFEIFTPKIFCSTPAIYKHFSSNFEFCKNEQFLQNLNSKNSAEILKNHKKDELNDLFKSASALDIELLSISKQLGDEWFFSGSGSSFFRICQ